jgi:hypothetical protein
MIFILFLNGFEDDIIVHMVSTLFDPIANLALSQTPVPEPRGLQGREADP